MGLAAHVAVDDGDPPRRVDPHQHLVPLNGSALVCAIGTGLLLIKRDPDVVPAQLEVEPA